MDDEVVRARAARAPLERLGARVPGFSGYLERELRREVDQLLRAQLATGLDTARSSVAAYTRTLTLTAAGRLARLSAIEKALDAVANALRHAGSGYGGLFDAAKVREEQLGALYRFDLDLVETVDAVRAAAAALGSGEEALGRLEAALAAVRTRVEGRDAVIKSVFSQEVAR